MYHKESLLTSKRLVQDNEKILHVCGALTNEFKKQELALSSTQPGREFSRHGATNFNDIGRAFSLINFPVRQVGRVKIWNTRYANIRTRRMVLACE